LGKSLIPALAVIKVGLFTLQGSLFPSLLQHPFLQKAFVEIVIASQRRSNLFKFSANLKQIASVALLPRNDGSH
jgi:hypothetical protein